MPVPISMLISDESTRYGGSTSEGKTIFWIRFWFSTSVLVMRETLSAKACQTMMPPSISSAVSSLGWLAAQRASSTTLKTNMYTTRLTTGKITDQKKPIEEPT